MYKKVNNLYTNNYLEMVNINTNGLKSNQLKYFNKETAKNLRFLAGAPAILITISLTTISSFIN